MFKNSSVKLNNKKVYQNLKGDIESYRARLDNFSNDITVAVLDEMVKQEKYHILGNISDKDNVSNLLNSIPSPKDLSLPTFLGQIDKAGNHFEIINLDYGYLFIYLDSGKWSAQLHICKPDEFNQYLDIRKTFKQTLPAIVRDTTVVSGNVYSLIRLVKLFV